MARIYFKTLATTAGARVSLMLVTTLSFSAEATSNMRYIQIKSFAHLEEVRRFAENSPFPVDAYSSTTGWIAVTMRQRVPADHGRAILEFLKSQHIIADDSYLALGNRYGRQVCCEDIEFRDWISITQQTVGEPDASHSATHLDKPSNQENVKGAAEQITGEELTWRPGSVNQGSDTQVKSGVKLRTVADIKRENREKRLAFFTEQCKIYLNESYNTEAADIYGSIKTQRISSLAIVPSIIEFPSKYNGKPYLPGLMTLVQEEKLSRKVITKSFDCVLTEDGHVINVEFTR